jgi:hypothetical protein
VQSREDNVRSHKTNPKITDTDREEIHSQGERSKTGAKKKEPATSERCQETVVHNAAKLLFRNVTFTALRAVGNSNLDLNSRLDVNGGLRYHCQIRRSWRRAYDLLDDLGGRVQVDHTLVDLHLETIPCLGTLTARSFAGGNLQALGGNPDGTLDLQTLLLGTLDEVGAHWEPLALKQGQGWSIPFSRR